MSGNQQFSSEKMANFFEPVKVLNVFWSCWKCLEDSIKEIIYKLIALISRISLVLVRGKSVKFLKPLGPLAYTHSIHTVYICTEYTPKSP